MNCGNIHLHLDLIAGLPGEGVEDFFASLRRTFTLQSHHLQLELVKVLPGSPLRSQAHELGLSYDPAPPYSVLRTPDLSWQDLEKLRGIGRLLDTINNSNRFKHFLTASEQAFRDPVDLFDRLQSWWQEQGLFAKPLQLTALFEAVFEFAGLFAARLSLREALARDFALAGRVVPGKAPAFFNCELTQDEQQQVKRRVKQELDLLPSGGKLQHFAAVFETLTAENRRSLVLYLYYSRSGSSLRTKEIFLQPPVS